MEYRLDERWRIKRLHGFCTEWAPQIDGHWSMVFVDRLHCFPPSHQGGTMRMSGIQFRSSVLWKASVALAMVALGDLLFFQWELGGGNLGFYGLALLGGMIVARPAVHLDRRAWFAVIIAALFAFAMICDASLLAWTQFWVAAGMAALLPASGRFDDGWRWFQRLLLHALRTPFAPMIDAVRVLKVRRVRPTGRVDLRASLPVLALPLIGSAVIIALFAAANPVLEKLLASIDLPDLSFESITRVLLWALLFIMAWSLIRPRIARSILPTFDGTGDLDIPGISIRSITLSLIMFNLLFALQNLMDVGYLGGFVSMPQDVTLAEYAHRGAYPLIVTALLAALFVIVTLRPGSSTAAAPAVRKLVALWIAQNILLVGSSILRTLIYVEAYSLTVLRISALAWMALVAIGLMLICWRLFAEKSAGWLINTNLAAVACLLTVASLVDLGAIAASWNVRHAKEVGEQGAALDLCYLSELGSSSLLPLIALERRADLTPAFRDRVQSVREELYGNLKEQMHYNWTLVGERRLEQAKAEIEILPPAHLQAGRRGCGGMIIPPPPIVKAPYSPQPVAISSIPQTISVPAQKGPSALTAETRK